MSTPAQEQAFYDAVIAAESVRQGAKAAAQVAYGFVKQTTRLLSPPWLRRTRPR
jgi:hypothetical protein